jgi:heat shock protein HslJ
MNIHLINGLRVASTVLVCILYVTALGACKSDGTHADPRTSIMGEPPVEWRLVTMEGALVEAPKPVILRLAKEGGVSGTSFVNNYFGSFTAEADASISFSQVGSTMMAGSPELMQSEKTYFSLLGQVDRFKVAGDTLALHRGADTLLEFVRQPN